MYFNKARNNLCDDVEPFSLKALAISKGKTTRISEVTPKLFETEQEVKFKKVYPELYKQLPWKSKLKRYFSTFIVIGASWSIDEGRWYYMITQSRRVFLWVNEDQIKSVQTAQTRLSNGPCTERFHRRNIRQNRRLSFGWPQQQNIDNYLTK